jgi:hypothetical protein
MGGRGGRGRVAHLRGASSLPLRLPPLVAKALPSTTGEIGIDEDEFRADVLAALAVAFVCGCHARSQPD